MAIHLRCDLLFINFLLSIAVKKLDNQSTFGKHIDKIKSIYFFDIEDVWEFIQLKHVFVRAVVLFLVCTNERNVYDQRSLEYHIYENHSEIKVIRRTLHQIRSGGFLSPSKQLIVSVFVCLHFALLSDVACAAYKSLIEIFIAGT